MINRSVTPKEVVELLNDALDKDHRAIEELFNFRVDCNHTLANHSTIQVRNETDGSNSLSVLGIINGFFGVNDNNYGAIAKITDDSDYEKLIGFEVLPN